MEQWKQIARRFKLQIAALVIACRDPRTPWPARMVALAVVAYALSPLDLIPDPIPILGYIDDLILLPLGIALAIRLTPDAIWHDAQQQARSAAPEGQRWVWLATAVIVAIWSAGAVGGLVVAWRWLR